jgi:hypothetical protein
MAVHNNSAVKTVSSKPKLARINAAKFSPSSALVCAWVE